MPELIAPTPALHSAWLEAHDEWGPGIHEDGFGLMPGDEIRSESGFRAWMTRLKSASEGGKASSDEAGCIYRWIVEDGRVLGGIALRYGDSNDVRRGGHVGYGIRPSARRLGYAGWALTQMLQQARLIGLARVVLVCAADNEASARTIEGQGGILMSFERSEHGTLRRYRIDL